MATAVKRNILTQDVKPLHYCLRIVPNLKEKSFTGSVCIDFIATDAPSITLNCVDISMTRVTLSCGGSTWSVDPASVRYDEKNETATIPSTQCLSGKGTLAVEYTGIIGDRMQGFYGSSAKTPEDALGVTQFESVDARRALPCWDEPARKATFQVTITARSELQVWSNTEVVRMGPAEGLEGWSTTEFQRTPVMSTYLLAWLVGRMESMERIIDKTRGGTTRVRLLTPRGMIQRASFALEVACKVLPLYEDLFGSDYVLSKVDLAAIPDFAAGAMENWGLITFRETALLCDDTSSAVHRRWVALVVAHELAHQWFGNLVTMDWWKELWLNESFATWIEYWAVDRLFPEWDITTHFVGDETARALTLDAMRSSHPIEVDLCNAREIDAIFDAISYSKGGSLLRMIVDFIGLDAFARGIKKYLKHFEFANATTVHLWQCLGEAADKDIASMMRAWTGEQGYPLLSAQRRGNQVTLAQRRYLDTDDVRPEEDTVVWSMPLTTIDSTGQTTPYVLTERSGSFGVSPGASWAKVNHNVTVFCRVCYSTEMLEGIATALQAGQLTSAADRFGLIADYHAFSRAGVAPILEALKLMRVSAGESHSEVWSALLSLEGDVNAIVGATAEQVRPLWHKFTLDVCQPALRRIGYAPRTDDTSRTSQVRASLLSRSSSCGDTEATDVLLNLFDKRNDVPIPSDLQGVVYAAVVRVRGRAGFDEMKAVATAAADAMDRARALRSLTASSDPSLARDALALVVDGSVRPQDSIYIVMAASANPYAASDYIDFVIANWDALEARLPGMLLSRVLKCCDQMWKETYAATMEKWWATQSEALKNANERAFQQGMEGLRSNVRWAARDGPTVVEYLQRLYAA